MLIKHNMAGKYVRFIHSPRYCNCRILFQFKPFLLCQEEGEIC